jgi:hypothetical protein
VEKFPFAKESRSDDMAQCLLSLCIAHSNGKKENHNIFGFFLQKILEFFLKMDILDIKLLNLKNKDIISPKYPFPKSEKKYPFLATLGYKDRI